MNRRTLEDNIWEWVNFVINTDAQPDDSGIQIVWGWGKGVRPKSQYISLNIISNPQKGQVYKSNVVVTKVDNVESGIQKFLYENECTVSIQGYGDMMADMLDLLRISSDFLVVSEKIQTLGLSLRKAGDVTNISEVLDEQNEQRFLLEVVFGYASTAEDKPGWMTAIDYKGEYNPPK